MKILKNYLYNVSFQLINVLIPFITLPYVSRILGAENIGISAYTSSIIIYFILIANVGTNLYGGRTIAYYRNNISKRSQVFWEIFNIKIMMASFSFLLLVIFTNLYDSYTDIMYLQAVHILAAALDISWLYIGLEDFKRIAFRNFFVKVFSCILIFIFVNSENDLEAYILILSLSSLAGNLLSWPYAKNYLVKIRLSTINIFSHVIPIIILFIPQVSISIFTTINKLFLGFFSTLSQVGYFDTADKLIRIVLSLVIAIGGVLFPQIANDFKSGNYDKANKLTQVAFRLTILLSMPLAFGLICVSDSFSNIFFGEGFFGISDVISILSIGLIFMGGTSVMGSQYLVAINQPRYLTFSLIISTIGLILFSIVLTPLYGAVGAAISALIGELMLFFIQLFYINKYFSIKYLFIDSFKILFSCVMMVLSCLIIQFLFYERGDVFILFLQVFLGGGVYIVFLFLLKAEIFNFIKREFNGKYNKNGGVCE